MAPTRGPIQKTGDYGWGQGAGRVHGAAGVVDPKEVAQCHRQSNGEGRGTQVVLTALVSGGEDAEH